MINFLNIDLETFSRENLKFAGLHKYCADPSFEILIMCYSLNFAPIITIDLASGEKIPQEIVDLILDPTCIKIAWNAAFERISLSKHLSISLDPSSWHCTMIKASMLGLPMSLEDAGIALDTDTKKAAVGKKLIRVFSIPCKPTKANGMRTRNDPHHFPDDWADYKMYCRIDVETEMAIAKKLSFFIVPYKERLLYALDQRINDHGVMTDEILITNAIKHAKSFTTTLLEEAKTITGLQNPNSVKQLIEWLNLEIDEEVTTLKKDAVHELLKTAPTEAVHRILTIRQQISKTSVKKYDAMYKGLMRDGRQRGLLQFLGAGRTWRWAGRRMQPQNLPQNHLADLALLRELELTGQFETIDMCYDTPDALSQLIRTGLIAGLGKTLLMSDFAAIEARVLAWLAQEEWKLEVFRGHGKIYEATASRMFNVPIQAVTKGSIYRQRGKVCELLCGYQGGVDAVLRNPANRSMGTDEEIEAYVMQWREANPNIKQYWKDVSDAAINAVKFPGERIKLRHLTFYYEHDTLFIRLPSGRCLAYYKPVVEYRQFRIKKPKPGQEPTYWKDILFYHQGIDKKTNTLQKIPTYGGKLVENIVQAVSRDILAEKMLAVDAVDIPIVFHVHDEIVAEIDENIALQIKANLDFIMAEPLPWTDGLPLKAETTISTFYRKD